MASKEQSDTQATSRTSVFKSAIETLRTIAITVFVVILLGIFIRLLWTGGFTRALESINVTHVEVMGVKLDFDQQRRELVKSLKAQKSKDLLISPQLVDRAIARAELNAGAIRGRRILWIDDDPQNNPEIYTLLAEMGIVVTAVVDDSAAIRLLDTHGGPKRFDLIVTDGDRSTKKQNDFDVVGPPLVRCPVQFMEMPRIKQTISLADYRQRIARGAGIPGGYRTVEEIAKLEGGSPDPTTPERPFRFTDMTSPRVIMFSRSNGGVATNPCIRTITNRYDYLFNAILSTLEEDHDPILPETVPAAPPKG